MNREILFRGKRLDIGEWVVGLPMIMWGKYHIITSYTENTAYEVDEKTIGQYTSVLDKNGQSIFEGDRVRTKMCSRKHGVVYPCGTVVFYTGSFRVRFDREEFGSRYLGMCNLKEAEVIGNIYD